MSIAPSVAESGPKITNVEIDMTRWIQRFFGSSESEEWEWGVVSDLGDYGKEYTVAHSKEQAIKWTEDTRGLPCVLVKRVPAGPWKKAR